MLLAIFRIIATEINQVRTHNWFHNIGKENCTHTRNHRCKCHIGQYHTLHRTECSCPQKKAADFAIGKLKPMIETEVSLEGIRIKLFNTVELNGLYLEDQQQDTLLYADRIAVRIHALELLKKDLCGESGLENLVAKVHRSSPDEPFNFQFLIDAFASEKDSVKVEKSKWRITAEELLIKEASLHYHVDSAPFTPDKFNANHIDLHHFNFRGKADFESIEKCRRKSLC